MDRTTVIEGMIGRGELWPVRSVNGCPRCLAPKRGWRSGPCGGCRELGTALRTPLETVEFVTLSEVRGGLEPLVREWKDRWGCGVGWGRADELATSVAAPLSAYLEEHADVLGTKDPDTLITWVPTSRPVIEQALGVAKSHGWYAPSGEASGDRSEGSGSQRYRPAATRLERDEKDWWVDSDVVGDRAVVMLDDVFTSGASMYSYAAALLDAGAEEVRAVALIRHCQGVVYSEHIEGVEWTASDRAELVLR